MVMVKAMLLSRGLAARLDQWVSKPALVAIRPDESDF